MEIKKSEIKTNGKNLFTHIDYLEISEDERQDTGRTLLNQEITKRSRSRSEEKTTKSSLKNNRHKHSKNNKYKRKRDRSKSRSSSDNSSSRQIHKRSRIIKKKNKSSSEESSDISSSRSSSCKKQRLIPSSFQKQKMKTLEAVQPNTQKETTIENSSLPNFFQEKKSKWSTVEEDESINKLREPRIIQVNPTKDIIKKDKEEAIKKMDLKDEKLINNPEKLENKTNADNEKTSKN
jgi:hypothetical protein